MSQLKSIARAAAALPTTLAVTALFAMMVMTFADVVLRSVANMPIQAATELTRILMAVVVFSALPVVSARGDHISVDLLDKIFGHWATVRDGLVSLACGAMLWWPAGRIVVLAERAREYGDVTEYLGIPQFYVAWFIAILTFATMAVLILRGLLLLIAPRTLEAGDD